MLPIETEGFSLTKSNFRDALCLRYGLTPDHMPVKCACSKDFNVEHALSCSKGGFPIVRHNEIRDLFANVLSQVCHDVALEPQLQEVDRTLTPGSNSQAGARLDISASGVWGGRFEKTLFDVRVFSPLCKTNSGPIQQTYRRHETEKRRNYESRVLEIEGASFCPIVLSTSGGQAPTTQALVKRVATLLSEKLDIPRPIKTRHSTLATEPIEHGHHSILYHVSERCTIEVESPSSRLGSLCHRNIKLFDPEHVRELSLIYFAFSKTQAFTSVHNILFCARIIKPGPPFKY